MAKIRFSKKEFEKYFKVDGKILEKISMFGTPVDDFEDELDEIDELNLKLETEQSTEQLQLIKLDLEATKKQIEDKVRDFFIQENYLNKKDVIGCLSIDFEKYNTLSRFDYKKKLFDICKVIFKQD